MKKIRENPNPKWNLEIECLHCHTRLLIDKNDIYYTRLEYPEGIWVKSYVRCLECQTEIDIPDQDLPPEILRVKEEIKNRKDEPGGN